MQEPTSEVRKQTNQILQEWQAGDLPFLKAVEQVEALAQETMVQESLINQGHIQYVLGYMHFYHGHYNTSIEHVKLARDHFEHVGNEQYMTRCDIFLGETYRHKGDFIRARDYFRIAHDNAARLGEIVLQCVAYVNEGQLLLSLEDHESARECLEKAVNLVEQFSPDYNPLHRAEILCEAYHALAVIHLYHKNFEGAWETAKQSLALAESISQFRTIGHANRTMGEVLTALETPPQDLEPDISDNPDFYFKASLEAFKQATNEGEMARTMHAHARSLAKRGQRVLAARKLKQATMIFVKLGMLDDVAKTTETQNDIF